MNGFISRKVLTLLLLVLLSSISAPGQNDLFRTNDLGPWNSLLMFSKAFGIHYPGWGLSYYGYHIDINEETEWIFPWVVTLESYKLPPDPPDPNARYFIDTKADMHIGAGISAAKRLKETIYLKFAFLIPFNLASSDLESKNEIEDYLLGVAMSQGVIFIPQSRFGLTFGVAIFERWLNSDIYRNDIGIQLEVGIKF